MVGYVAGLFFQGMDHGAEDGKGLVATGALSEGNLIDLVAGLWVAGFRSGHELNDCQPMLEQTR